jgi:hypothetical protein
MHVSSSSYDMHVSSNTSVLAPADRRAIEFTKMPRKDAPVHGKPNPKTKFKLHLNPNPNP